MIDNVTSKKNFILFDSRVEVERQIEIYTRRRYLESMYENIE